MEWMVEAKGVSFEYPVYDENGNETGSVRAIDHVDIQVKKGEFVAVLGHNGSGIHICKTYQCLVPADRGDA